MELISDSVFSFELGFLRYRAARNLMLSGTDFCDLKGALENWKYVKN